MILLILLVLRLYCVGTVGIIWLMCELMNWPFSVPMAVGVWFLANVVIGIVKGRKRNDNGK